MHGLFDMKRNFLTLMGLFASGHIQVALIKRWIGYRSLVHLISVCSVYYMVLYTERIITYRLLIIGSKKQML